MTTENLLPCPFCGTQPEWVNEALADSNYHIRCPHCQFTMKQDRRDKVIGFWNRREQTPTIASVSGKREQIEDILWDYKNDCYPKSVAVDQILAACASGAVDKTVSVGCVCGSHDTVTRHMIRQCADCGRPI